MYNWCQNFKSSLPNEIEVYYEDEDFICYIVQQNPEHLYDLGKQFFTETLTAFTNKTVINQKGAKFEKKKLETVASRNLNHTAGYPFYNNDMDIFPN